VPEVLQFLQQQTGSEAREAYGNLNMGAGFALFVAAADADRTVAIATAAGVGAMVAGRVEAGPKRVVIEPLGLTFDGDELHLRA
jgi:phosphoribosylformylglycinamidine cyclo-ligase